MSSGNQNGDPLSDLQDFFHLPSSMTVSKSSSSSSSSSDKPVLFDEANSSGKHLIADIQDVENVSMLDDLKNVSIFFDSICEKYDLHILHKIDHVFQPQGFSLIYMLSESHISIHTFPEKRYAAIDLYTCRQYTDNTVQEEILQMFMNFFHAKREHHYILDRTF